MIDRRAQILDRLAAIVGDIATLNHAGFYRNRGDLSNTLRPFLTLHDGSEELSRDIMPGSRIALPLGMQLFPEISYLPRLQLPLNETIDVDVHSMRMQVIAAVLTDAALHTIVGANGKVSLRSIETDLAIGKRMSGETVFRLAFSYPLLLSELT